MKLKSLTLFALAALTFGCLSASAQTSTWTIDTNHSSINFQISHASVSTVRGFFSKVTGTVVYDEEDVTKSSVNATIDTSSVNTGNEARDKHLRTPEFFNVEKFPTMTFKSTSITRSNGRLKMTGDLTLSGVTKSVTFDVDGPTPPQKGMGGKTVSGFSASGLVKRSDFGIAPKYPSVALGDDIKFTIDVEIDKQ